jgi:hypothetical protein
MSTVRSFDPDVPDDDLHGWDDSRRWAPGQVIDDNAMPLFRCVPGSKGQRDLRLEWFVRGAWRAVPMAAGLVMADFFFENENVLFPWPAKGGGMYLGAVTEAARKGWMPVAARLADERAARRREQERRIG